MAAELDLPVQIHTGMGQGRKTNAAHLQPAIQNDSPFQVFLSSEKEMVLCQNVQLRLLSSPTALPGAPAR